MGPVSLHIRGEQTRKSATGAGRLDGRGQYDPSESESALAKVAVVVFCDTSRTLGLFVVEETP
jgi:hypothetical protein